MTESNSPKSQPKTSGCLIFIVIYLLCLIGMYFATTQSEETKDITGRVAKEFSIAGFVKTQSPQNPEYKVFSLETLRSGNVDLSNITFLLPEKAITINVGDIHHVKILEDHGEWQLVAFNYSNTRTSTSTYRAYNDRIEPVAYKLTSFVGQVFSAIILVIPALILSMIVKAVLNWRAKRAIRDEDA
ncbi:hypothetical protein ACFL0M_06275 [Thermodesulfobacteriota bacterium]